MTPDTAFLWGPLGDPDLCAIVLGEPAVAQAAVLADHGLVAGPGPFGAALVPRAGAQVVGQVVVLTPSARARLEVYALALGLPLIRTEVTLPDRALSCQTPLPQAPGAGPDWDAGTWARDLAAATRDAARALFALAQVHAPDVLRTRYPMLLSHCASRQRAGRELPATALRRAVSPADVVSRQRMEPYTYFFAVQVDDLQFRRFDGTLSPTVRRAGFVMADAVTILPYDPVRDAVLVIEQFRYGPFLRGAPNPWVLEPVAGRIDPGERPDQAALREISEETHLRLGQESLVAIGSSYPSPGAISELLFNFIALCDLPDTLAGIAGLASEAEDIRSHILPLDQLLAMIDTAEAQNGPLIQSAYWLALNRARLRLGHSPVA